MGCTMAPGVEIEDRFLWAPGVVCYEWGDGYVRVRVAMKGYPEVLRRVDRLHPRDPALRGVDMPRGIYAGRKSGWMALKEVW